MVIHILVGYLNLRLCRVFILPHIFPEHNWRKSKMPEPFPESENLRNTCFLLCFRGNVVEKSRKPMWAGIATDGHDFENKSLDGSADEMAGLKQLWIKWRKPICLCKISIGKRSWWSGVPVRFLREHSKTWISSWK